MEPATKRRKLSNELEHPTDLEDKPESRHSLFVRGLAPTVTSEDLVAHFSQSYPLKHGHVIHDPATKLSRGFGFVTFADAEDAKAAFDEFNNTKLDGHKLHISFAESRQRDIEQKIEGGKTRSVNTKGEELRAARKQDGPEPSKLIVRNLPWSIKTAEDLTKLFLSYGKVKHAVVPKLPGEKGQAGFGIVVVRGRKNSEKALEGLNGKVVDGRTLAVDWAVDKETWQKAKKEEASGDVKVEEEVKPAEESADEDEDGGVLAGEVDSDQASEDEGDDADADADADEDENLELDASDISSLAASETETAEKQNYDNTTVFIRNLAYDVDDEILGDHFRTHFGPIRYARVVYDAATERSRGTGFVCFRTEDDAKNCVKSCPKQEVQAAAYKAAPSLLQNTSADPSGKYTLNGRLLNIVRHLPKGEADRRAAEGVNARREKLNKDKRRLYLISEGTVSATSALGQQLSKTDLDVRTASFKQRQKLIKTNPNLGFSLTRLSVRNLPRWVDTKYLKHLATQGVVGFAKDVTSGIREPISKEELARDGGAGKEADAARKEKGMGIVKQSKIVFESSTLGMKVGDGKGGRSRGYGFIEYWTHRNALMGLRWLNGYLLKKPDDLKTDDDDNERSKRLIVEFAIENAQVVQRRDERERRVKDRQARDKAEPQDGPRPEKRKRQDDQHNARDSKRQRSGKDTKPSRPANSDKKEQVDAKTQDEKNKIAARNRLIGQKRQKRRNRKA